MMEDQGDKGWSGRNVTRNVVAICILNPKSLDNKGSCWVLKNLYCSVTMLRELGLKERYIIGKVGKTVSTRMLTLFELRYYIYYYTFRVMKPRIQQKRL